MGYRIHKCFGLQHFKSGTHFTLTSANAIRNICTGLFYLTGQSRADRALPALGYVPLTCFLFPFCKATALLGATLRDSSPAPLCLFKHGKENTPHVASCCRTAVFRGCFGVRSDDFRIGSAGKNFPSAKSLPELLGTGLLGTCWVQTSLSASGCVSISLRVTGTHDTLTDGLGIRLLPSQGLMGTQHLLVTSEIVTQRSGCCKHFFCLYIYFFV